MREYRGIETILGFDYENNCDIWSLACMLYELLTNNYLFRPKDGSHYLELGNGYTEHNDHLALMIETLGAISRRLID